jgi:hypothetical protein
MSRILINELTHANELDVSSMVAVRGGLFKRNGLGPLSQPGYKAPTVISDDGINVQTTDPLTSNVAFDSPFTPIIV